MCIEAGLCVRGVWVYLENMCSCDTGKILNSFNLGLILIIDAILTVGHANFPLTPSVC